MVKSKVKIVGLECRKSSYQGKQNPDRYYIHCCDPNVNMVDGHAYFNAKIPDHLVQRVKLNTPCDVILATYQGYNTVEGIYYVSN